MLSIESPTRIWIARPGVVESKVLHKGAPRILMEIQVRGVVLVEHLKVLDEDTDEHYFAYALFVLSDDDSWDCLCLDLVDVRDPPPNDKNPLENVDICLTEAGVTVLNQNCTHPDFIQLPPDWRDETGRIRFPQSLVVFSD